ncbi:hypothetical protein [Aliikangiella sp. IMCC44359]|uniref:hypothetical protein n=1 Tax=Aliikangiella sp. IMCC44359 TaxID=3459125 RepID=UPI00403AB9D3
MSPEQLIESIKFEIENLVSLYSQGAKDQTEVGLKLDSLDISSELKTQVLALIELAIKESTYNLLSGLEGSSSLAGTQEAFNITDESGNELSSELDTIFYEQVME